MKNGVTVEELLDNGSPSRLWDADRYECLACGNLVITGFGSRPLMESLQAGYVATRARLQPILPARS
jgi:hypothetical protein